MVSLFFEKLSMFPRQEEPCTVAVPFAEGTLTQMEKVSIVDGNKTVPTQSRITATWPDGSVKWLLSHFLADLPANQGKHFTLSTDCQTVQPLQAVRVVNKNNSFVIQTGAIEVELSASSETGLFRSVRQVGHAPAHHIAGPIIRDESGNEFVCQISDMGWSILEAGPVRCVVAVKGKHQEVSGGYWFDFEVRVYAYAGKPWLTIDYQIINRELNQEQEIHAAELKICSADGKGQSDPIRFGMGRSNYRTNIQVGSSGDRLSQKITAETIKYEAMEHIPESFSGTFWADICDPERGGISVTLFQAQQNFPKSFEVTAEEMTVGLIPKGESVTMLQGMAKTHRFFLHVHGADETLEQINVRSLQLQLEDRPILEPETYENAGVVEPLLVNQTIDWVERGFYSMADNRTRTYGMLHWGDAPDQGYTQQGRGNGDWVWLNNEYDLPHAAMHLFARTGTRRFQDYLLRGAEHWKDVDICHYSDDPLRLHGQIMHSAKHVTGATKVCHQWVEGLLDYYHLTGEKSALDAAIGIGENVRRNLNTPRYQGEGGISARESGWALRSLGALYKETYDEKWLDSADHIVDHFETWKTKYGAWLSPYTDHSVVRVVFMIAVAANSLMRYYQVRPQERIKQMILHAMDDLLEHCYLKDKGVFYYKELPTLQRLNTNPIILESLSYAYEFTGDLKFLEAGRVTFREGITKFGMGVGEIKKELSGDAVISWGHSPKLFAQYYFPLFYYYRTATHAGFDL